MSVNCEENNKKKQQKKPGRRFSSCTPVSSTIKTDRHDIANILMQVALLTTDQTNYVCYQCFFRKLKQSILLIFICLTQQRISYSLNIGSHSIINWIILLKDMDYIWWVNHRNVFQIRLQQSVNKVSSITTIVWIWAYLMKVIPETHCVF